MSDTAHAAPGKSKYLKMGAIGLLSSVLAGLLGQEFFAANGTTEGALPQATAASRRPGLEQKNVAVAKPARQRPKFEIEKVLECDPFRLPDAMAGMAQRLKDEQEKLETAQEADEQEEALAAKKAELQSALESLAQDGVSTIIQTDRGNAAVVGSRILHEGDVIDGFVVVKISRDGIELAIEDSK